MAANNGSTLTLTFPSIQEIVMSGVSPEDCNGHLNPAMEPGIREILDRVEEFLAMMTLP